MATRIFHAETTDDGEFVFRMRRPRMFDDETRAHFNEARKDMLRAVRNVIDAMLSATEAEDEDRQKRRRNINVD